MQRLARKFNFDLKGVTTAEKRAENNSRMAKRTFAIMCETKTSSKMSIITL